MVQLEPHTTAWLQIIYDKLHDLKELLFSRLFKGKTEHGLLDAQAQH